MSSRKLFAIIVVFFIAANVVAQKRDKNLQRQIQSLVQGFNGDIGVYVKDLRKNRVVEINADSIFPTASMVKVPIMIGVMQKIETGELLYDDQLIYKDSLLYAGVDILGSFKAEEKIELSKVMMLMLTMSDNTASLWLQSLAGTGTRINQLLDSMGFRITRVNSRTPGREANRSMYGWGQTSPREMATLLEMIYNRSVISARACEKMLRYLGRNFWDDNALAVIPPTIEVFSKNGAVDGSRSEVLLVNKPNRPYVFCISTKNIKDQSWKPENEAWQLAKKISTLLWNHFK